MSEHFNPWLVLPSQPPYVLPCDSDAISQFNVRAPEKHRLQLDVLPEPFIGYTTAPVVLLSLNPGFDDPDLQVHARPEFQSLLRSNYSQNRSAFPFYFLHPGFENGGRRWWESKLNPLLKIFEREQLAQSIFCVEYFPYHSRRFAHAGLEVPSQEFGFGLVRSAIVREAVIVIMRGSNLWKQSIPTLETYRRAFTLNSPQNVVVSPRNRPGFEEVVSAIRDGGAPG